MVEPGGSFEGTSQRSFGPRKFDNHPDRRVTGLHEQNEIIVLLIADLAVDQLDPGTECLLQ